MSTPAISPVFPALFRRAVPRLFGAAALVFAMLTTNPAIAAGVAPGSSENGYARRCADIANNIAKVPADDYTYIVNSISGDRFGARESSIEWFWGHNAEGEHVSYDGYCPSAKEWLETNHDIVSPQKTAGSPNVAPGSDADAATNYYERRCADVANNIAGVSADDYDYIVNTRNGNRLGAKNSALKWFWGYNKKGREVSYDGYCPEQKAWLAERNHFTPAYDCPENSTAELFRAAQRGKAERAKRLISECNADINWRNNYNQTPLTWAIRSGNADMVALLLDKGGDVDTRDKMGRAPLHTAALDGDVEMVNVILGHFLTDVNVKDYAGLTPTDWAAYEGHAEIAAVLRENGGVCARWGGKYPALCGVATEEPTTEEKPAEEVAQKEELSCVVNARSAAKSWEPNGDSYRRYVFSGAWENMSESAKLAESLEVVIRDGLAMTIAQECLGQGANPNARAVWRHYDRTGVPLLHLTALKGGAHAAEMARLLLKSGADVNARHWSWGFQPPTPAPEVPSVYLTVGPPDPANPDTSPDTVAKLIASHVADLRAYYGGNVHVQVVSDNGFAPMDYAARNGNAEVAAVLRGFGGECRYSWSGALCDNGDSNSETEQNQNEQLSLRSDAAREDLTEMIAEGINALPQSFDAVAAETGLTPDMKVRMNIRRDFRRAGADWGMDAHFGAVGEADSQAAFAGVNGSKDFADGWRAVGAAKVARGWARLDGGLERGALWASEFSAGVERLGLFYAGDALGFGVSQPLYVEHWEAEAADGRRFLGSPSGRLLNVDASYRVPLPGGEGGAMKVSAAVGRESGSGSDFAGNALISAEWDF